jgi:outer membrane lipoprotein-sorting protein
MIWLVAIVTVAGGSTAIALAATGNGPAPPPKPLAEAAHDALAGPAPEGVTARVTFTNNLLSSSSVEGADPLLSGGSGRLWLTRGHLRIELQSDRGDAQVVADDTRFWVYEPRSHTVYKGDLPEEWSADQSQTDTHGVPSLDQVKRFISRLMEHAAVSGATPGNVGGRPAYTVRLSPSQQGGMVGAGELAWDALNGVPLRIGVFAKGSTTPVLELTADNVSYGPVSASDFAVSPPPDAKVVDVATPSRPQDGRDHADSPPVEGVQAVARALPFDLVAPPRLAGLPRNEVRLLDAKGHEGSALVTYGHDLGGIAVIEQARDASEPSDQTPPPSHSDGEHGDLSLPTVSINGIQAQELATPLGTVVRFERGGVAYTVIGSVPPATAEAAARGL